MYSLYSNYNQYPTATAIYNACSNNSTYPNAATLYNTCSNSGVYSNAESLYNACTTNTNKICSTVVYCFGGRLGAGNANQQYGTVQQFCSPANNSPQGNNYGCGNGITSSLALSTICANQYYKRKSLFF